MAAPIVTQGPRQGWPAGMRMNEDQSAGTDDHGGQDRALRPVLRDAARDVVRAWLRDVEGDALGRVGAGAIRGSADAAAYLTALVPGSSAAAVLDEVERLATAVMAPPAAPAPVRWWQARRAVPANAPPPPAIAPLIERLDRQRDDGTRRMIALTTARTRFAEADRLLEEAMRLIDALAPAIEAGAREIRGDDPARAATVQDRGAAILTERRHAVLTQSAVHRQAMMTLGVLIENQQTLNAAIGQARTATLAAVQVAAAAQRATTEAAMLKMGPETGGTAQARRMLDDALGRARTALTAMTPPRDDRSTLD